MRTVGELDHPRMKITLFHHNGKYTAQFEAQEVNIRFTSRESDKLDTVDDFRNMLTSVVIDNIESKLLALQKHWTEISQESESDFEFDTII